LHFLSLQTTLFPFFKKKSHAMQFFPSQRLAGIIAPVRRSESFVTKFARRFQSGISNALAKFHAEALTRTSLRPTLG
jgi:hypothetical protein